MRDLSPPHRSTRAASILHDTGHHAKPPLSPAPSQGSRQHCCTLLSKKLLEKATSVPAQTAIHNEPPSIGCRSSCKLATDMHGTSELHRSTQTAANPTVTIPKKIVQKETRHNQCLLALDTNTKHHSSNSKICSSRVVATNVTAKGLYNALPGWALMHFCMLILPRWRSEQPAAGAYGEKRRSIK
jgi:hypothetical protein